MARETIITCDICGKRITKKTREIKMRELRNWLSAKVWESLDICDSCGKEMVNYIKKRRLK